MRNVKKEEWRGYIKGLQVEIVTWNNGREKPIWNSYIIIRKENLGDRFKEILCKAKKSGVGERYLFDYWKLNQFEMHGGVTFYEKIYNEVGKVVAVKVGCDYAHIWDEESPAYYEAVLRDLEETVNHFIECFPEYKVWCNGNGKFYSPSEGEMTEQGFRSNEYYKK